MEKLREIDAALRSLASAGIDVSMYDSFVPDWYRAVFSFEQAWNTNVSGPPIQPAALAMLRGLSTTLSFGTTAGALSEAQRHNISDCVNDAFALLEKDPDGLSPAELAYVYTVLDSVRSVVEGKSVLGAVDLQRILDQLVGALAGLAAQYFNVDGDDRRSKKVLNVVGRIIRETRSVTYDAAALATIGGYVAVVQTALNQ